VLDDPSPDLAAFEAAGAERFEILAIGSSAGGVGALRDLLHALPGQLPVPIVVVQHLDPRHETVIAEVIGRRATLVVKVAEDEESMKPGVVYVAPPDHHLLVGAHGLLTLSDSELVHFLRPSADLLFESVAAAYNDRAIACVLTGSGSDGAMGVTAVRSRGGTVIVQSPETSDFRGMPDAAVATGDVDFVLPLDQIASVIARLVASRRT
jgi:two-component system chemotaxis response regulator CheB